MSEAYAKFNAEDAKESSTHKALCVLMAEHDFLVDEQSEFSGSRYILHLGPMNEEKPQSTDLRKVDDIKSTFDARLEKKAHKSDMVITKLFDS